MKKNIFISTSIPYVNADPHLGHAMEFVHTDALARYFRKDENVFFVSGTDDNALKNVQAAEKAGMAVEEFVRSRALRFGQLAADLKVSHDYFIETSKDPMHKNGARKLWEAAKKDIYKKKYKGLYCVGCEEFKTERDIPDGKCPEHPDRSPEIVEEENYFFKLSKYQEYIRGLIVSGELTILPESRKNEVLSFIDQGLDDFSISRSTERAKGWGIPVPGDDSQIQYVWFDALSNYINALGYAEDADNFKQFWQNGDRIIHCIGKGITRFHAIYWPAMLKSAGLRSPTHIYVHGYITVGDQKMSKSLGNVINPFDLISEYNGADALRYYLLRHVNSFEDSDITLDKFREAYNAHLANGIGNLTARIMKMANTHLNESINTSEVRQTNEILVNLKSYDFNKAMNGIWFWGGDEHTSHLGSLIDEQEGHLGISGLDSTIQIQQAFKQIKTDPINAKKRIRYYVQELYRIAVNLEPFMPDTAEKIKSAVKANKMPEPLFMRK